MTKKLLTSAISFSAITTLSVPMLVISCEKSKTQSEKTVSNLSYSFDDKTSTASVLGFDKSEDKSKVTEIIIPSTIEKNGRQYSVTSIANGAFDNTLNVFENLSGDLIIPNSIIYIGDKAFYNIDFKSGKLVLSSNLISIGDSAFAQPREFVKNSFSGNLVIPNKCISIGKYAFQNIAFNGTLTLSQSLKSIGERAFYRHQTIKETQFQGDLIIPNSVEIIERNAFTSAGFNGGLKLSTNEKFNVISIGAFQNCNFKVMTEIPENITTIESYSLYGSLNELKGEIKIPKTVLSIGNVGLWAQNPKGIISFYSTTKVDPNAFKGWEGKIIIY